ncbi:MAG TPA: hypothetical protein VMU28_10150 [Terriglobales bacterium]|nr:hypothetical protein [Terriglobales bacterium]
MNQLAIDTLPNSLLSCAELMNMAQRELASFFNAVTKLFGSEQAELSAEDWLHEVAATDPLPSSIRDWRRITLRAAGRLASRVNSPATASQPCAQACV